MVLPPAYMPRAHVFAPDHRSISHVSVIITEGPPSGARARLAHSSAELDSSTPEAMQKACQSDWLPLPLAAFFPFAAIDDNRFAIRAEMLRYILFNCGT